MGKHRFRVFIDGRPWRGHYKTRDSAEKCAASLRKEHPQSIVTVELVQPKWTGL
jgi:hypothetical protein